jgi:hypothetical protein
MAGLTIRQTRLSSYEEKVAYEGIKGPTEVKMKATDL